MTEPAAPVYKAVCVGGECDGQIVRLMFDPPPTELVLLVEQIGTPIGRAFVAPVNAFPNAVGARAVIYHHRPLAGWPEATRILTYVPKEYPTS